MVPAERPSAAPTAKPTPKPAPPSHRSPITAPSKAPSTRPIQRNEELEGIAPLYSQTPATGRAHDGAPAPARCSSRTRPADPFVPRERVVLVGEWLEVAGRVRRPPAASARVVVPLEDPQPQLLPPRRVVRLPCRHGVTLALRGLACWSRRCRRQSAATTDLEERTHGDTALQNSVSVRNDPPRCFDGPLAEASPPLPNPSSP